MSKFVVLSSLALFVAFYQMSGGSDFKPAESIETNAKDWLTLPSAQPAPVRAETAVPATARAVTARPPVQLVAAANAGTSEDMDDMVTRASASVDDLGGKPDVAALVDAEARTAAVTDAARPAPVADTGLPDGKTVLEATRYENGQADDNRREVAGDRVNVRYGPGTRYSILGTLTEGQEIEVIDTQGDWVKLRMPDNGRIGWMANWLVTASAD